MVCKKNNHSNSKLGWWWWWQGAATKNKTADKGFYYVQLYRTHIAPTIHNYIIVLRCAKCQQKTFLNPVNITLRKRFFFAVQVN